MSTVRRVADLLRNLRAARLAEAEALDDLIAAITQTTADSSLAEREPCYLRAAARDPHPLRRADDPQPHDYPVNSTAGNWCVGNPQALQNSPWALEGLRPRSREREPEHVAPALARFAADLSRRPDRNGVNRIVMRNLMSNGELLEGVHFFKRRGRVMFSWPAMRAWVERQSAGDDHALPLVRNRDHGRP